MHLEMLGLFTEVFVPLISPASIKVVTTSGVIGHHGLEVSCWETPIQGGDMIQQPMGEQSVQVLCHSANIGQVN